LRRIPVTSGIFSLGIYKSTCFTFGLSSFNKVYVLASTFS
jgi:hypothetical protein